MCGIAGILNTERRDSQERLCDAARSMAATLHHRGPDDHGAWADADAGVAFGHTRLSIVDLSACGHQPMHSPCGRCTIVFNGEIYNFRELRKELKAKGHTFRGESDTEVLLAAVVQWGVVEATRRTVGMFAFAVWDASTRKLSLVRDRLGIKPLYYGRFGRTFLFGSELKALRRHPAFQSEIDRESLSLFMQHNYIPAPYSIYQDAAKLMPGTILQIDATGDNQEQIVYWSMEDAVRRGVQQPFSGSLQEAADTLDELLTDAVRLRMVADVPLGAFLSGGIDSSLVTALLQKQSSRAIQTFSLGFEEAGYDEAPYAREVAKHLATAHTEAYVSPQQARDVIPLLPTMFDEPFSDSSQIPTFLVSQLARQHVTVSLSGDGGDELFGGYTRYFHYDTIWRKLTRIPVRVRQAAAAVLDAGSCLTTGSIREKVARRTNLLRASSAARAYQLLNIHWSDAERIVLDASGRHATRFSHGAKWPHLSTQSQWMYTDAVSYLPDDILVKVDRASMAVGLEARVPILDHRVVEFAWTLPEQYKISAGQGKLILRDLLARYVPAKLFERPKVGFGVPIDAWLRGPLREWANELLAPARLRSEGYFRVEPIERRWSEHLRGTRQWHYYLWDVLMFQAWLENSTRSQHELLQPGSPATGTAHGA